MRINLRSASGLVLDSKTTLIANLERFIGPELEMQRERHAHLLSALDQRRQVRFIHLGG
jgi:hypothetical protein